MYKCQVTGEVALPGEKSYTIVTRKRPQNYTNKIKKYKRTIIIESTGWEIAEEKIVCKKVYLKHLENENDKSDLRRPHGQRS